MVTSESGIAKGVCCFTIRPNASLSVQNARFFFIGVCLLSISLAIRFWLLGLWVVLPLSIAELVLLGICLRMAIRSSRQFETIKIDDDEVIIRRYEAGETTEWRFQTYWVKVSLENDPSNWYPGRLMFSSHGRSVEVASFLTDEERELLAEQVQQTLIELHNK